MRQGMIAIFGLCFACSTTSLAAAYAPKDLVAPATRVDQAPTIDGRLDDAAWRSAVWMSNFRLIGDGQPAQEQSACAFVWNDAALFLAVRCKESALVPAVQKAHLFKATAKQRDGAVFHDDCIEVFLAPKGATGYMQLAANALGTRFDSRNRDPAWNAEWKAAARKGDGEWTMEIAVPFASLGVPAAKPGDAWRFNVCRDEAPAHETSSLCGLRGAFHTPGDFGQLQFVADAPGISSVQVSADENGRPIARFVVASAGSLAVEAGLEAKVSASSPARVASRKVIVRGQAGVVTLAGKRPAWFSRAALRMGKTVVMRTLWTRTGSAEETAACEVRTVGCRAEVFVNGRRVGAATPGESARVSLPLCTGANVVFLRASAAGAQPSVGAAVPALAAWAAQGWRVRPGFDKSWLAQTDPAGWSAAGKEATWAGDRECSMRRVIFVAEPGPRCWPAERETFFPAGSAQMFYPTLYTPAEAPLNSYRLWAELPPGLTLKAVDNLRGVKAELADRTPLPAGTRCTVRVINPWSDGMQLNLRWADANKNTVAYQPGIVAAGASGWTLYKATLRSPAAAQFVHPLLIKWQNRGITGTAYFDNLRIAEKGTTHNLLEIGTFEEPWWKEHRNYHIVTQSRDGKPTRCVRLRGTEATVKHQDAMWVGEPIPVKPNTDYEIEALVKCEDVRAPGRPRLALLVQADAAGFEPAPIRFGFVAEGGYYAELPVSVAARPLPKLIGKRPKNSYIMPCYYSDMFEGPASDALARNALEAGVGGIFGKLTNRVCRALKKRGAFMVWAFPYNAWQTSPCRDYVEKHPECLALNYKGKREKGRVCPTCLLSKDSEFQRRLREWVVKSVKGSGYDEIDCDYEVPVVNPPTFCFCPRCLAAFRREAHLADDVKLDAKTVVERYRAQWTAFRCKQNAEMMGLLARWVREAEPGMKFSVYSGYQKPYTQEHYGVDWRLLAPVVDMGIAGYGGNRAALAATRRALAGKPFIGGEMYSLSPSSTYDKPLRRRGWAMRLLRAYVNGGCHGVLIWYLPTMDGWAFFETSEAAAAIADFEDVFQEGERVDSRIHLGPEQDPQDYAAFEKDGRVLLLLFNPSSGERSIEALRVRGWAGVCAASYDLPLGRLRPEHAQFLPIHMAPHAVAVLLLTPAR